MRNNRDTLIEQHWFRTYGIQPITIMKHAKWLRFFNSFYMLEGDASMASLQNQIVNRQSQIVNNNESA